MSDRLIRAFAILLAVIGLAFIASAVGLEWLQIGAPGLGSQQWAMMTFGIVLAVLSAIAIVCGSDHRPISIFVLKIGLGLFASAAGLVGFQATKMVRQTLIDRDRVAKVAAIQELLRTDHDCGYLYEPNLEVLLPTRLQWLNATVEGITIEPITTDDDGFDNHPDAIAMQDGPVDIIGLGDSFIDGAARPFFEIFRDNGYQYHSYAMHRHCPPQYNRILTKYVLDRKPKRVFYGIFVNDFWETADFAQWQASDEDWFTYHDGTWCGAPRSMPLSDAQAQLDDVLSHAIEAAQICESEGIDFVVWLIPNKEYVVAGVESDLVTIGYDRLSSQLRTHEIAVLDLRKVLADRAKPERLFWKQDAHWSHPGMRLAAESYLRMMAHKGHPQD